MQSSDVITERLATFVRARLREVEMIAEAVQDRSHPFTGQWAQDGTSLRTFNDHVLAYLPDGKSFKPGVLAHIALHDPAHAVAEVRVQRLLVDDFLAQKHVVVEDCWYTCPAATQERDGGETCDDGRLGRPCTCGRDMRVQRGLHLLAFPYMWHPDHPKEGLDRIADLAGASGMEGSSA